MRSRRFAIIIASIVVSGVLLWLALREVDLQQVLTSMTSANLLLVLLGAGLIVFTLITRAVRWRGLLDNRVPPWEGLHIIGITFMANQLPLRAGEVARSALAMRSGVPFVTAATSIVVERLLDTVLVVVLLAGALTQVQNASTTVVQTAVLFGVLAVVAFVVLLFFAHRPAVAHALLAFAERLLPLLKRLPLRRLLDHFIDGLQPLTHWQRFFHAVVWTLIAWSVSLSAAWVLVLALGIDRTGVNTVLLAVLSVTLASFSIAIPITLASLGPFQLAVLAAGQLTGLDDPTSLALGFLFQGVTVLVYVLMGTLGLLALGVSFSGVLQSAGAQQNSAQEAPAD